MKRKDKWWVYGEYGGTFTNLKDAKECAKRCSTYFEYGYKASVWLIEDGCNYFTYLGGKLERDGWTIPKEKK